MVATGDQYLPHVQPRAEVSYLPGSPTEVTCDDQPVLRLHERVDRIDEAIFHVMDILERLSAKRHVFENLRMVEVQIRCKPSVAHRRVPFCRRIIRPSSRKTSIVPCGR